MRFLAFVFGWWVFRPYSLLVGLVLRLKGVRVGRNFYIQGTPFLKLRGDPKNVIIGDNVRIHGDIDLRNRENGKIIIEDNVTFDTGCRLVAANDATLHFEKHVDVGGYCIFNCGTDVAIGQGTLLAGFCYIQSSSHGIKASQPIRKQPHSYGKIDIRREVWIAGHVTVLPGVTIGDGAVIGAKAVVTRDVQSNTIMAGVPAKPIGYRPN